MADTGAVHSSRQWATNCSHAKQVFDEAGVRMRTGMWSLEERRMVEKNVARFLKKRPGLTVEDVVFSWSKKERKGFYKKAAKGIRRPLNSIYTFMTRRYHPHNYVGVYSPEEETRLLHLYDKYGPKWKKIGRKMERTPISVCVKHIAMLQKQKAIAAHGLLSEGRWSDEEHALLEAAVREISDGGSADAPIVWDAVATRIPGKTARQCRKHWWRTLALQGVGNSKQWSTENDVDLITTLYGCRNLEDGEIPWDELQPRHWPDWPMVALKSAWQRIRSAVPGQTRMVLDEVLLWLYDHYLPKLQKKLEAVS